MASKVFIGTLGHLRLAPSPRAGMTTENSGYSAMMTLQGGGAVGVRSAEYHKVFNLAFTGRSDEIDGVGYYNRLATGFHGQGLIVFNNPADHETNLFAAGWASPGLGAAGWSPIASPAASTVAFPATVPNTMNQPAQSATYTLTGAANAAPASIRHRHVIVIPPTMTLHFGWSGTKAGAGGVYVRPVAVGDGVTYAAAAEIAPLAPTASTRMSVAYSGQQYKAIEVYLGRSADAAASVTIASMMARLFKSGGQPTLNDFHTAGQGHTGCMFGDEAITEEYPTMHPHPRKGMSTKLIEVGAWQR